MKLGILIDSQESLMQLAKESINVSKAFDLVFELKSLL